MKGPVLRLCVGLAALAMLVAVAACGGSSSSDSSSSGGGATASKSDSAPSTKGLKIGSLVWGSPPYFTPMIEAEKKAAQELGADLDLQNAQSNQSREIAIIQQFIAQKKDVIVATPSDSKGIAPIIKQANAAGIPVIANNTVILPPGKSVTYVGSDNVEYGRKLAQALVAQIGEKGNVAVILGLLGSSPQFDRSKGFKEELKKHPGIKIVAEQTAAWENQKALSVTQDFLNKFPKGKLDAIVDQGPEAVPGAQYAARNGRSEVKFIVGDVPKAVKTAIQRGLVSAAVYQSPSEQGRRSVLDAAYWATGQKDKVKTPTDYTPIDVITKENIDQTAAY